MMKTASRSSVAVSFGSRRWKRIVPSALRRAPATIASPSTSSAFANSEPMIDVCATTISPARSANSTMKSSGRLPSVDCRTPVTAGPKRAPTDSVAIPTAQARPPSAMPATTNDATSLVGRVVEHAGDGGHRRRCPPGSAPVSASREPDEAHALVHRRRASAPTPRAPSRPRARAGAAARPGRRAARGSAPGSARPARRPPRRRPS